MPAQARDKKGRPVKFIRVKGRVVPIAADKHKPKSKPGMAGKKRSKSGGVAGFRKSGKGLTNRGKANVRFAGSFEGKKQSRRFGVVGAVAAGVAGKIKGRSGIKSALIGGAIGFISGKIGGTIHGRSKMIKRLRSQHKKKTGEEPSTSV